jgi:phosphatidylglycerol:prolipoprotein diacylglycerol transferase
MIWNPSEGIDLGFFTLRYYSLMWILAFGLGFYVTKKIFIRENEPLEKLDSLFLYTIVATMLGARLGHVIFYQPELFKQDFLSVFLPIRTNPTFEFTGFSGLASHGAAIGILIAMVYFSKKVMKRPLLWVLDRITLPIALGAIFIRIGNFINSEIYGVATSSSNPFGVKFLQEEEFWRNLNIFEITQANHIKEAYNIIETNPNFSAIVEQIPYRHPAQLYEAFGYVLVFIIMYFLYWKTELRQKQGYLFGVFLILLWSIRFVVEFVKQSQGGFEGSNPLLSTGQWLSIPFILLGLYLIYRSKQLFTKSEL